jgi:putative addiction module CopG family antidote
MLTNLSPEIAQLVAQEVASGRYRNEEEVLTEAVQLLSQRNALREQIAAGSRQLTAGEYTDYDSHAFQQRLKELKTGKTSGAQSDA